jgi:Fic family protein
MREYDYSQLPDGLLQYETMELVSAIHEYRGKQDLFIATEPAVLTHLLEVAKIQSITASNSIEGIHTTDERIAGLVMKNTTPRNRSEEEIAGYREVLAKIHESYDYIKPTPNVILQFHRDLYQYNPGSFNGKFKNMDNLIAESGTDGTEVIRFQPVSAFETPESMARLCTAFDTALSAGQYDPLLLIPLFILDFLCIHPFNDGNGRMSRLLTLLLLYRSGYIVGKYISIEKNIEDTKESYYEALEASSDGWHDGKNNYFPFVRYFLSVLFKCYKDFTACVSLSLDKRLSKPDRIRALFVDTLKEMSKQEILQRCPDISLSTIETALAALLKERAIIKTGAGKKTRYIRNVG